MSYEHFKKFDLNTKYSDNLLNNSHIHDIFNDLYECVMTFKDGLLIENINRSALEFFRKKEKDIIGHHLSDFIPSPELGFLERYLYRAQHSGERHAANIRLFGTWVHFQTCRISTGTSLIFRDVSEDIEGQHSLNVNQGAIKALEASKKIGFVEISAREMVNRANRAMLELIGAGEKDIRRIKFSSLIPLTHRMAFADTLEEVFRGNGARSIPSMLVDKWGKSLNVQMTISELRGVYEVQGAIILISPTVPDAAPGGL